MQENTAADRLVQPDQVWPRTLLSLRHIDRRPQRPIRESDVDIDYRAVIGSRESLWRKYGEAWGWPADTMTYEADKRDLARHEAEIAAHETFNYAVLDEPETELLGCVYIDPPDDRSPAGTHAVVSWWVVDAHRGSDLERTLGDFLPRWLLETWGFEAIHYHPP